MPDNRDQFLYLSSKHLKVCQIFYAACRILSSAFGNRVIHGLLRLIPYLKVTCSFLEVFKRTFCDEDKALISCPDELRLVFHNEPFYGQVNSSDSCPASGPAPCTSGLTYGGIEDFCNWHSCVISTVSGSNLDLKVQDQCKDTSNYLTVYHSCQQSK